MKPFSLRLPEATVKRLSKRATRTGTAPRSLAQRYVEEGLRRDEHPLIHFVDGPAGRRASVLGSGLDVSEIVETVRDNEGDAAEAARYLEIQQQLVDAALTYYGAFRDEIDAWIEASAAEAAEAHEAWLAGQRALAR